MLVKENVTLFGLQPVMRPVLKAAEGVWKSLGRTEGVTITETVGEIHSAGSWHYYGYAIDVRINYTNKKLPGPDINAEIAADMLRKLLPAYDVVVYNSHIHIEIGNILAYQLGVNFK